MEDHTLITLNPIAWVKNSRKSPLDDHWLNIISEIELDQSMPNEALLGIDQFSHLEIIYYFNQLKQEDLVFSGHPRGKAEYPLMGILAQRKKDRPNQLGLATVELLAYNGRTLKVKGLDALDGTPVLDIKPVFKEFEPRTSIKQPSWVSDLMQHYW